jgi:hypothetical protein
LELAGTVIAVKVAVSPMAIVSVVLFKLMLSTAGLGLSGLSGLSSFGSQLPQKDMQTELNKNRSKHCQSANK